MLYISYISIKLGKTQKKSLMFFYFILSVSLPLFIVLSSPLPLSTTCTPKNCLHKHTNTVCYIPRLVCFKLVSSCHLLSDFPQRHLCFLWGVRGNSCLPQSPGKEGGKFTHVPILTFHRHALLARALEEDIIITVLQEDGQRI